MKQPEVKHIDAIELKRRLDENKKLCLIDVREQDEWDRAHISEAVHIPKATLLDEINKLAPDKNQSIYLYCQGGTRSTLAAEWLLDIGYQEVYSVAGGIRQWESSGFPLIC